MMTALDPNSTRRDAPLPLPPIPEPFRLPFYCGAWHNIGIDYLVNFETAANILGRTHPRLAPADFDGRACFSLNYQLYFAQYGDGSSITEEVEINIIAYPQGEEHRMFPVSYEQYATGIDQTKLLGIGRIHVLCDNVMAIEAGSKIFAEPKLPARFTATMPSLNGPETSDWHVRVLDADFADDGSITPGGRLLFSIDAHLGGLACVPVNNTPVTGYGTDSEGRLLTSRQSVYHPYQYYLLDSETAAQVSLHVAEPTSLVGQDLTALLTHAAAAGMWTYQSAPVAAHSRPYYLA
ncbi:hypothetical protein GCM10027160_52440 [Streptomyces calidiresistens]